PGPALTTTSRGMAARTRAGIAGIAVLGASVAGLALPGTAMAATNASATTTFHAHPDSGNHGNWADDDLTRTASVSFLAVDPTVTDCGSKATTCFQYTGTISDIGAFFVISGANSPQAGVTETGTPSGPFKGGSNVTFFSSSNKASESGVPANVSGAGPVSTANWVEQFFPSGTTFGAGPNLTNWSWSYSSPGTCENWTDAFDNGSGSRAVDGDITGVSHCLTGTGPISSFVNHSACLDNSDYTWADGNPQQIWKCGAAGGVDQNFRLATYNGAQVLQAVAPAESSDAPWCVTAPGGAGRLTIQACTGTGGQVVKKEGAYYVFTATGDVMDLKAFGTTNGNAVLAWTKNGGKNQRWSLP
ncbi:MAG: ricin-type beta-trefoil lectin domain protein, partial [Streptosporangiaceae bacterium]